MRRLFLFGSVFFLLVACTPTPAPERAIDRPWTIMLAQSGGFAGVDRRVSVTSAGNVQASDVRAGVSGTTQITAAEIEELEALAAAAMSQTAAPEKTGCADCFIYDLEIQAGEARFRNQADDVNLAGSGMEPLVTRLRELMDKALGVDVAR